MANCLKLLICAAIIWTTCFGLARGAGMEKTPKSLRPDQLAIAKSHPAMGKFAANSPYAQTLYRRGAIFTAVGLGAFVLGSYLMVKGFTDKEKCQTRKNDGSCSSFKPDKAKIAIGSITGLIGIGSTWYGVSKLNQFSDMQLRNFPINISYNRELDAVATGIHFSF